MMDIDPSVEHLVSTPMSNVSLKVFKMKERCWDG